MSQCKTTDVSWQFHRLEAFSFTKCFWT